jgi:Spy/CpxP family protein refolding chaperone
MMKAVVLAGLLCTALAAPGTAQVGDTAGRGPAEKRAVLERQFRARLAEHVQSRLGLTAEQTRRLQEVDRRYQPERRRLMAREMEVRRALRRQVAARDSADQAATATLLDQMIALQRERTELLATEQRDLATFLTPVQRAQVVALQADLQRRVMNARRGGGRGHSPGDSGRHPRSRR